MSKIQWESNLVERPFCEPLQAMGRQWIEGDTDLPEFTERQSLREVLLKDRLAAAPRKLNLRDGQPWLDDERIGRIIEKMEKPGGPPLMDRTEAAIRVLLKRSSRKKDGKSITAGASSKFTAWPTVGRPKPSRPHPAPTARTHPSLGQRPR